MGNEGWISHPGGIERESAFHPSTIIQTYGAGTAGRARRGRRGQKNLCVHGEFCERQDKALCSLRTRASGESGREA